MSRDPFCFLTFIPADDLWRLETHTSIVHNLFKAQNATINQTLSKIMAFVPALAVPFGRRASRPRKTSPPPTATAAATGKKTRSLRHVDSAAPAASTFGGVCISTKTLPLTPPSSTASSLSSTSFDESAESTESSVCRTASEAGWKRTDTKSFAQHMPLLARDPEKDSDGHAIDDKEELNKVLTRAKHLPDTWYFSSNHVMVNQDRVRRSVAPVTRLRELDEIARCQAAVMAEENSLFHMSPTQLQESFPRVARRFGVNVAKGESIRHIHEAMMNSRSNRNNILDRRYTNMGMGTARGPDGELFLCQIFRG
jgi:Cysteine-rich secretory protein family